LSYDLDIQSGISLAPHTSLGLGGEARYYVEIHSEESLIAALGWADEHQVPTLILGGGSNLVVADAGFEGLVIKMDIRGLEFESRDAMLLLRAGAGEPWDPLVERAVARGAAGIECLSGIPGLTGATPIQNVGAYGQEVSQTIRSVRVLERATGEAHDLSPEACEFGYRDSMFKREPGRYIVLSVLFALTPGGAPTIRYGELSRALGEGEHSLARVREEVIRLRRAKGMVLDPQDPASRSAGSFFTNPILAEARAQQVFARAVERGVVQSEEEVPRYPAGEGQLKLAAGWLIERAGVQKGDRRGAVGISPKHCLSLVHYGGGTAADLVALGREVQARVLDFWGVHLEPEPVQVGFDAPPFAPGSGSSVSK